jgi:hypothetical protein
MDAAFGTWIVFSQKNLAASFAQDAIGRLQSMEGRENAQ